MPTSWRKLAVAGIAGVAATVAFATPALACHPEFSDQSAAACVTADTAKVTWIVSPDRGSEGASLDGYHFFIGDQEVTTGQAPTGPTLANNSKFTLMVPKTAKSAKLSVTITKTSTGTRENVIDLTKIDWTKCKGGETGGQTSAPASPTKTVAGASSSAAALPVTGSSTGIMAGVAVVLLAGGVALFFVARRRRVRFTAA